MGRGVVKKALPAAYASLYPVLVATARRNGYALAIHGSVRRDFDLIAIPWVEDPSTAHQLVDAITKKIGAWRMSGRKGRDPSKKPHGRLTWQLHLENPHMYLDFSVMPVRSTNKRLHKNKANVVSKLGEKVKAEREFQKCGLRAAADYVGISPATFCRIENGYDPGVRTLALLVRWLDLGPKQTYEIVMDFDTGGKDQNE